MCWLAITYKVQHTVRMYTYNIAIFLKLWLSFNDSTISETSSMYDVYEHNIGGGHQYVVQACYGYSSYLSFVVYYYTILNEL